MDNPERYQTIDELGRGGMGIVYRARDTQLGREVALKLLPATLAQEETALRRFQQEAQIIAQLEHPHIVPIHDIGVRDGQPFIVMRLLRGGSFQELLKRGRITPEALWRVLGQIGRALDTTHAQNIIHRDIKPTNILFDEHGQAYLADFGIAKALDATTQYTGNAIIGSPAYMSPEQFTGETVSGRTDQYSLAIVAFEALAGQLPFQGNTSRLMYGHVQQPPPAISTLNNHLPAVIDKLFQRALAKEPSERFENLEAFVNALERAGKGSTKPLPVLPEPIQAEPNQSLTTSRNERVNFFYRQGLQAIETRQWPEAVEAFGQVLALDPNHTNAQNRYNQVQQQLQRQPAAVAVNPQPISTIDTPASASHQIVKGAGGTVRTSVKRRSGSTHTRWLIGGLGLAVLLAIFSVAMVRMGNRSSPLVLTIPSASDPIQFNGQIYTPKGTRYRVLENSLVEIVQGEMVVQTLTTSATIRSQSQGRVVTSEYGLVGVRYDTGVQRLIVHCLRSRCLVEGNTASRNLSEGQATSVSQSGELGDVFEADYGLFGYAPIVPTPEP